MKFCCLLALIWSKPGVTYKFIRIQNLWQNAELGIYIFLIWETVSEWFIWHLNWPSVYNTTHDDGAILSISKGSSVEETRHQTWESRKTWDHIREAQMAASPKLAGDHQRSPAVSMWTWTGERYDRSRLALRVSPRIVKRSCSYMRDPNVGRMT